jgi:hypothetical protein
LRCYRGAFVAALASVALGCSNIRPHVPTPTAPAATFSDEAFARVLQRFVDDRGQVDYAGLSAESGDLEQYYAQLAEVSPDNRPDLFPTAESRLAYWINAYNAVSLVLVVRHYPIAGVGDIQPPIPLIFPRRSGFFLFHRITLGGTAMTLYSLENDVIRQRFRDPRVYFVLTSASRGCPPLSRQVFAADRIDAQLDAMTQAFFADERNLRIDERAHVVFLSSILDWYGPDIIRWYQARSPAERPSLLKFAALFSNPEQQVALDRAGSFQVRFTPYDWRLNDQSSPVPRLLTL